MTSKSNGTNRKNIKRDRSIFDTVSFLDSQDDHVEKRKRQHTKQDDLRRVAATSQTKLFASLMECRILLQRAMQHADATSGVAVDKCNDLLYKLLHARNQLMESGDADNAAAVTVDYKQLVLSNDTSALHAQLQQEYDSCREDWKETLNRRHKDVRLHAGLTAKAQVQFRVMDTSFWQQVDATVQHEQLRSSDRADVFDDTKVYQHLLQDFVLSANQSDTLLAEERLTNKNRNKTTNHSVDRKASKGRRIRYHEIPKLVNFTFPLSRPKSHTVLDENEWFSSLFGGVGVNK
ncbi:hypothetical protein MPSEU_000894700 [Mayamaea pseudoterrestris]|nr:hypothetical protein MPSEU_000894700 [Mayamaea pseudoterrestris]